MSLKQRADLSDLLLVAFVSKGLTPELLKNWELFLTNDKFPTLRLSQKHRALNVFQQPVSVLQTPVSNLKENKTNVCSSCKSEHNIWSCPEFIPMQPKTRSEFIKFQNVLSV